MHTKYIQAVIVVESEREMTDREAEQVSLCVDHMGRIVRGTSWGTVFVEVVSQETIDPDVTGEGDLPDV